MFPKDNPEIIIFASIKRPNNGSNIGLKTMTHSIMESIAKYKGLISSKENIDGSKKIEITNYINLNTEEVVKDLENKGLKVITLGDGNKIIDQYPKDTTLVTNDKIFLLTNGNVKMPSLIGYSRLEAISLLNLIDVDYEMEGYGFVTEQSIKAGEKISDKVKLKLEQNIKE